MKRYEAFVKILDLGSFSKAAVELGYTQSAISQMVKSLEEELSSTLILRSRKGISLTADGEEYLPYIKSVYHAWLELREKKREMEGLQSGIIRVGTFASVSCHWLPGLMKGFKLRYPSVQFKLEQGEYTMIDQWIREGTVDFGFINPDAARTLTTIPLWEDEMMAVLPKHHPLVEQERVTLKDLTAGPFIVLEEGEINEPLNAFRERGLTPDIQYQVYDDYTIMAMVEQGLGVALLPKLILEGCREDIITRPISPPVSRMISLAYKDKKTLPVASRYFVDYIIEVMVPERKKRG